MSKLDNNIINNIKMLSLDMIKEAGSGDVGLSLSSSSVFYNLFMNHLKFSQKNPNWINRDRVIVSNRFLPVMYSTLHLFGYNISLDNLREFKKLNSNTLGFSSNTTEGIEINSQMTGDVITSSVGIALGKRYLDSLIKIENPKNNLINFHTYCICTYSDIMSGNAYEALSFANKEKLNNLIIVVIKDDITKDSLAKDVYKEDLEERFEQFNFEVISAKGHNLNDIDGAFEEAKASKCPSIVIINTLYGKDSSRESSNNFYNIPLTNDEMNEFREKYKISEAFNVNQECYEGINRHISKRLDKAIAKWEENKANSINDIKIKNIIDFLENKNIKIDFNVENIKINDNYEEELYLGNNKIFNILASKSPFILNASDDNYYYTKCIINKSDIMSKENPTGRNILFGGRTLALGGVINGLASLGFKMFVSTPLINSNVLRPYIRFSTQNNLPVNYIFTQDTFTNTYEDTGLACIDEINSLRIIPNLITFRPADINEIIGVYNIISNYKKTTATIIGSEKIKKLTGTNHKYVVAGAYRARRERGEANGILIATGAEVSLALKVAEELFPYGIDLRVITMPSQELFELQNDRYKYSLLPKELKTFILEFGNNSMWHKYATADEYILGINKYSTSGTKEELLKYHKLDVDTIKTKIIEIMKK